MFSLAALAKYWLILQEMMPLANVAVAAVHVAAPAGTPGADKFAAASKMMTDAVNATTAVVGTVDATKAALAGGDAAVASAAMGHAIEMSLSAAKTFGLFPKAAIVQSAAPLAQQSAVDLLNPQG